MVTEVGCVMALCPVRRDPTCPISVTADTYRLLWPEQDEEQAHEQDQPD